MPLGFICGFTVGLAVSLKLSGHGVLGFLKRLGLSLVITAALVALGGWMGWATANHHPLINDQSLALDIEV